MASESSLLVDQVPKSFAALGQKHNALVDLLRTMTGSGACKVTFSENKIIISVPTASIPDPLTIDTLNATNVIGSTGYFTDVISTYGTFQDLLVYGPSTSYGLEINSASLTHSMSIKEIDVCSGGVAKKMLIIASDPY